MVSFAAKWGIAAGLLAGSVEATWHLSTWKLYAGGGAAQGFLALAAALDALAFGAFAVAGALGAAAVPGLRARLLADPARAERFVLSWVLFGVAAVFGTVWWKLIRHVNALVSDPAIWLGLPAVVLASAVAGAVLGRLLAPWVRGRPRAPGALVVAALLVAGLALAAPSERGGGGGGADGPRVLFVTLDTVRADRLHAYGNERIQTPHLDRLAREGALFEQAIASAPTTEPSHLSMLSSTFPHQNGIAGNGTTIPGDVPMIQELLRDRGAATAGFVSGFPVTARFGFDRGFGVFDDDFGAPMGLHRLAVVRVADQFLAYGGTPRERTAEITGSRAVAWLRDHARGGFFAWVHFYDPHGPYTAPAPYAGMYDPDGPDPSKALEGDMPEYWPPALRSVRDAEHWIAEYDAEITWTDSWVGRLLQTLEAEGVLDSTLVVVTADHGESLTEHGYLFDHGLHLYDAEMRVPLLMRLPGKIAAGTRVPCQVRGVDIAPTITDLLGLGGLPSFRGDSLRGHLGGEGACGPAPVALAAPPVGGEGVPALPDGGESAAAPQAITIDREAFGATLASRHVLNPPTDYMLRVEGTHRLKYVARNEGEHQLFDLVADPGEERDLLRAEPGHAAGLRGRLDAATSGAKGQVREADPEMIRKLCDLGYMSGPECEPAGGAPAGAGR
ncbi:sulfatase [Myxococcota bacterium]|nr:sulfatase [Myxococcota bacterium]